MSSIASGRVSANSAVSSSASATRRRAPARAPAARGRSGSRTAPRCRPEPRRGMKRPVLGLDRRRARPARPTPGRCTAGRRTAARSARRRPRARRLRTWCGDGNGCSGEMWSPLARQPAEVGRARGDQLGPPVGEVRRHLDADVRQQLARDRDQPPCRRCDTGARPLRHAGDVRPSPQARAPVRAPPPRSRSRPAPRRSSAGAGRSSAGSPPAGGRARRAPRRAPRSAATRSSSRLADADEDPAREGDLQLARPRGSSASRSAGSLVGEPWWATRSSRDRLEHQPLRRGHLAQPRQVLARERAEVRVRQQPALQRPLAAPHDVGDEVRRSPSSASRARTPGWCAGSSPVRTSSSLTLRRAAPSSSASTSSGACRCGRCVANAQYLQCETHVRESDSVRLREKVTRRRIPESTTRDRTLPRRWPRPHRRAARRRDPLLAAALRPPAAATTAPDQDARCCSTSRRTRSTPASTRAQRGYDDAEGVHLKSERRARPRTGSSCCSAARTTSRSLDIHDLALAARRAATSSA